ncbi:hypothetical protein PCH_Pc16g09830 [Penicillium rubens Wisconsin 54-1255]|uniref:Uncharacterized protein n=1 Tax=Penicillium rubens (strain ATCC 28089 / DSM 1075 / NRRL 1951 / Wisconsin 54-1255) TaxID=500485 RepID=B6H8W2_PENRW|nr:hypothetical protein PCH_Pc16g09830 [Penicillium rubens Wisconsin 54-1255]
MSCYCRKNKLIERPIKTKSSLYPKSQDLEKAPAARRKGRGKRFWQRCQTSVDGGAYPSCWVCARWTEERMGSKTPHEVNEAERKSYWTLSDSTWMKEAGGLSQNNIERRDRKRDGDGGRLKRRESF